MIIDGEEKIKKDFKDLNKYNFYLAKSISKLKLMKIVEEIKDKISYFDEDKLNKVLNFIKDLADE